MPRGDPHVQFRLRIPGELLAYLRREAVDNDTSVAYEVRRAVEERRERKMGTTKLEPVTMRDLTDAEREAIKRNASGEDVYCGDRESAEQIARGACDRDDEWSDAARNEAIAIAQYTWSLAQGG